MLVKEIKQELKKYKKEELEKIIIELYKRIPKAKKEEYAVDDFIKNYTIQNNKKESAVNFDQMKEEIYYFIKCARFGCYASPNKVISKKERSNWRFKVKRYYKYLTQISPDNPNGEEATNLLIWIFELLSYGTHYLVFVNWDTFKALGVMQSDYYDMLIKRIVFSGYTKDNLQKCIDLLDKEKSPYEYHYDMFAVFISNIKTVDTKILALNLLTSKAEKAKVKMKEKDEYYYQELYNSYVECIFDIYLLLDEIDKAIHYFKTNYFEKNKEVKMYIMLEKLDNEKLYKYWIMEYEANTSVNYRESLQERYQEIKNKIK